MSLAWQLALRFRTSKRENGFISFISASSTMGIALGCLVLILLLSVMNGFERELKDRLLRFIPHGELFAYSSTGIENWQSLLEGFKSDPRINHVEPYSKASGLLQKGTKMKAISELVGIDPQLSKNNSLVEKLTPEDWQRFEQDKQGILLGKGLMTHLDIEVGDKVQLLLPQLSDDLSFQPPKTLWLTVAGEINIGGELDSQLGFMHLSTASETLGTDTGAQGIRFSFDDAFAAPEIMRDIGFSFDQHVYMSDWTRTQGHLYQDIQLVRTVVYVALTLVLAVACFNIVSTLVMAVNEKQAEIAMLRTMGARDKMIIAVFVIQGAINGFLGTVFGVILGVLLALNLTSIATFIETLTGKAFLSGDIYFINFLPSQVIWTEVTLTAVIALSLSLIATIYPAIKATKINPAEALGQH